MNSWGLRVGKIVCTYECSAVSPVYWDRMDNLLGTHVNEGEVVVLSCDYQHDTLLGCGRYRFDPRRRGR